VKQPKNPYPTAKVLGAMLQADDDRAVRYVLAELRFADGNVTKAAEAIGCGNRTLYSWRDGNQRLRDGFEKHALGRAGAGVNATEARLAQRVDEPPRKKK
jgi:transposase-like protein